MAEFKAEIVELKRKEDDKEDSTIHFRSPNFNIEELTEEDMAVYGKFKDQTLTLEEFNEYRDKIVAQDIMHKNQGVSPNVATRGLLVGYIGNKLASREAQKLLEEMKKRKQNQ